MSRTPAWLTVAFVLALVCTAAVTYRHEISPDEADSWLLMRDGGVFTMLAHTGNAGTPSLWYLLIAPLAAVGFPFEAQQILNLLIAWAALWLMVYKAPFRPWLKLAFLFSYFPAYEFPVISRPYAAVMALLFWVAAVWPERLSRPMRLAVPVSLLANVATHGTIIAAMIGATYLFEVIRTGAIRRRANVTAVVVMFAAGCAAAVQLWVPPDGTRLVRHVDPGTIPYAIGAMLLPFSDPRISFSLGLLLLLSAALAVGRQMPPLLFMTGATVSLLAVYQFIWYGGVRHSGIILVVVIASLWMASAYDIAQPWRRRAFAIAECALAVALVASIPITLRYWRNDVTLPFSASREAAAFIAARIPQNVVVAAHPPNECEPVLAYLARRRFWYVALARYGSYMPWGRELDEARLRTIDPSAEVWRRFGPKGWVLLIAGRAEDPSFAGLRLLYRSPAAFANARESYRIYEPIAGPQ